MAIDQSMRIAELLESRLADIARGIGMPVAWPNIAFEPPDEVPYGRVYMLPAQTVGQDFAGQLRTYQGIFQVNIVAPAGIGISKARTFASTIAGGFPEGLVLIDSDFSVYINGPPQIRQPIQDENNFTIPVSMQYRADY
ncbi:DUF4128 domain-containing protein [Enterobacter hormaechei]|uniref:DUF4128 domain-containing protein n=1 Tax=Enterobacter hormaechei TaxID=158836 RepID=UPI0035FE10CA